MQYCVSVALQSGTIGLSDFTPAAVQRPEIRELFGMIDMQAHDLEKECDSETTHLPAIVDIVLKDGQALHAAQEIPKGDAANPLNDAERLAKFTDCCQGFLPEKDIAALQTVIDTLEKLDSIRDCTRHLRFEAGADRGERFERRA
jgi:2-methylcitrate dehydratase PrpD